MDSNVRVMVKFKRNYRMQDRTKEAFYDTVTKMQLLNLKRKYPSTFDKFKNIVDEVSKGE